MSGNMDEKKAAPAGERPERERRVVVQMAATLEEMLNTDFTRGEMGTPQLELRLFGASD